MVGELAQLIEKVWGAPAVRVGSAVLLGAVLTYLVMRAQVTAKDYRIEAMGGELAAKDGQIAAKEALVHEYASASVLQLRGRRHSRRGTRTT